MSKSSSLRSYNPFAYCILAFTSLLAACNHEDTSTDSPMTVIKPKSDCAWQGPYSPENPQTNFAFPDSGAAYWSLAATIPAGAEVFIKGKYPHARYMSFVSYNEDATALVSLPDYAIEPNEGSINPFIAGNSRIYQHRDYTIKVVSKEIPSDLLPKNTLFTPVNEARTIRILYRVYVPDKKTDILGGVQLPEIEVKTSEGKILSANDACYSLKTSPNLFSTVFLDKNTYLKARDRENTPIGYPSFNPPKWWASYNNIWNFRCMITQDCSGTPIRTVGKYPNPDNAYTTAIINRDLGEIAVLRGKIPKTPRTLDGAIYTNEGDLRYWSICNNEYYSQKVSSCLFDEQVPIKSDGKYNIVVSRKTDKPLNATPDCGNGYLEWSEEGDGFGHPNDGYLIMRNMLPSKDFKNAVQNTKVPGDENNVLGEYLPTITYMSRSDFEKQGCQP